MSIPLSPICGTEKVGTDSSSSGTEPNRMNGRNLPNRLLYVLSTMRPAKTSANASKTRTTSSRVPAAAAEMPATSV